MSDWYKDYVPGSSTGETQSTETPTGETKSETPPTEMVPTAIPGEARREPNLSDEFREFGKQLTALLKSVRESPRAKEIEQQVTQAMREMEREVNQAMETARVRAQQQNLKDTLKGAAATAADEAQRGLAKGLRVVNEKLAQTVQETQTKMTTPPPAATPGTSEQVINEVKAEANEAKGAGDPSI